MDPISLLIFGAKCAAGAVVAVGGAVVALPALGFSSAGIAAGSIAAGIQSLIGNVAAGSVFAAFQSAGVLGLAGATQAILGAVGAAAGGVLAWFV